MAAQRVRHLGPLAHQQRAQRERHRRRLRLRRAHRHELHTRTRGGFGDRLGVDLTVLAAFDEPLYLLRRHQPDPVAQALQQPLPVVQCPHASSTTSVGASAVKNGFTYDRRSTTRSAAWTPWSVKTDFDVSIAARFSSIGQLLGWLLDSPTLAFKAAGPSTQQRGNRRDGTRCRRRCAGHAA